MIYYEVYDKKSDEWVRVNEDDFGPGKVIWVDKPEYIRVVEESDA
jgi:hypothetical protein